MTLNLASSTPWTGWFNRDLIENMPIAVYVCDRDGVLVAYNRRAAVLWGRTPVLGDTQEKFCGAHRLYLTDGSYVPHHATPLALVLETHQPYAFEAMVGRPDGSLRNVSANVAPLFNDNAIFVGFVNCVLDITDSKRATEHRDRMWTLSQDLMLTTSLSGNVTAVNPACHSLLGWDVYDIVGSEVSALVHADDTRSFADTLQVLARSHKVPTFEVRMLGKDGRYRWMSWSAVSDGAAIHAVARDISVQKEQELALRATEDALRQSQKMDAIGQLTGGVAHDFNNYLTIIRSSADILKFPNLSEERRARFITTIADTADRAGKLTAQLLIFARRQALQPKVFDVGAGIRAIGDMIGTLLGSRITVELSLPATPCMVRVDPGQLDTAIVNMLVNARDAISGHGLITVKVGAAGCIPAIRSHAARQGDFVTISITDTGSGIASEHASRIFEPFFTTKAVGKGTGLGLAQVFGFTKQSGGEIMVDSVPGSGATFTLFLPRHAAATATETMTTTTVQPAPNQGTRILVVEDNRDVGEFAQEMLQELGYEVELVTSGKAALSALAEKPHYAVVFSDIEMPGMSGIELIGELRRDYPALPVLLTSAYSPADCEQAVSGIDVLQKPYTIEQLAAAVRRHV